MKPENSEKGTVLVANSERKFCRRGARTEKGRKKCATGTTRPTQGFGKSAAKNERMTPG